MKDLAEEIRRRPLLQITTWRSGSTPIHQILSSYLKQTQGLTSLSYFFDIWENSYEQKNGKILQKKKVAPPAGPFFYSSLSTISP